jgi:hypothetical protein
MAKLQPTTKVSRGRSKKPAPQGGKVKLVSQALVEKFDLLKWDDSGQSSVWVRQAKFAENSRMRSLFSTTKVQENQDGTETYIREWPAAERTVLMCWLTFQDASIMREGEGGKPEPMFKQGMSESDFRKAFNELDDDCVNDWVRAVLKMNPQWSWSTEELEGN